MSQRKKQYNPVDAKLLKTFPMECRQHKVDVSAMAGLPGPDASIGDFLASFPNFLGVKELQGLADAIVRAYEKERPVFFAMGAHVIKVGCSPIVIDLMERGILSGFAMNGAGGIHDFEVALYGQTSEDVGANLHDGRFGMTVEAPAFMAEAARRGSDESLGLGAALGQIIEEKEMPNRKLSLMGSAYRLGKLAAVHVAVGTDTVHMHPQANGCEIGEASMIDFRKVCSAVMDLAGGGVWVNVGSAVILPEVFLKAVSVARNLGADLDEMVTANLDMLRHYRVQQNVLSRPVRPGKSYQVTGHHEILLPMLRMMILQRLENGQ